MSLARPSAAVLTVRYMEPRDLAQALRLLQRTADSRRARRDVLCQFHAGDISSWVAEVDEQVVGFVMCRVRPSHGGPARRFELKHLVVASAWRRRGIASRLLRRFDDRLRPGDRVRAVVPESNLTAQLFLRAAGFRALRVLRGRFGDEDGYLLVR